MVRIRYEDAVVAGVTATVPICIEVTGVRNCRAVVAGITYTVAVGFRLIRVGDVGAIVQGIVNPVAVRVDGPGWCDAQEYNGAKNDPDLLQHGLALPLDLCLSAPGHPTHTGPHRRL